MPPPAPTDENGWAAIDALAVAECSRSPACALSDVPREHRGDWAAAIADILELVTSAGDDAQQRTRGLKWLLVVSDLLLRKPQRGGARAIRGGVIPRRFERWRERDLRFLLAQRATDHAAERHRSANSDRTTNRESDVARALHLIASCELSRAGGGRDLGHLGGSTLLSH